MFATDKKMCRGCAMKTYVHYSCVRNALSLPMCIWHGTLLKIADVKQAGLEYEEGLSQQMTCAICKSHYTRSTIWRKTKRPYCDKHYVSKEDAIIRTRLTADQIDALLEPDIEEGRWIYYTNEKIDELMIRSSTPVVRNMLVATLNNLATFRRALNERTRNRYNAYNY